MYNITTMDIKMESQDTMVNRYEKARIIGARALQISMGAPALIDVPADMHDSVEIATLEFENGVIPITILKKND